jgi:hypothetical protein
MLVVFNQDSVDELTIDGYLKILISALSVVLQK